MVAEDGRSSTMSSTSEINWGNSEHELGQPSHDLLPHISPTCTERNGTIDESMATFIAAPTQPEEISEDLNPDAGIIKMMWRSRGVVSNIGFPLKDIVDNQNKATGCMNNTFRSIAAWA